MTKATTMKAITIASAIALSASFGASAFAHDISKTETNASAMEQNTSISKSNAKNLVKSLLKNEYRGENYQPRSIQKVGDAWQVKIVNRTRTIATALVDSKTGNIHVQ